MRNWHIVVQCVIAKIINGEPYFFGGETSFNISHEVCTSQDAHLVRPESLQTVIQALQDARIATTWLDAVLEPSPWHWVVEGEVQMNFKLSLKWIISIVNKLNKYREEKNQISFLKQISSNKVPKYKTTNHIERDTRLSLCKPSPLLDREGVDN